MLEVLLPGGTLFALLFFLYRRLECGSCWGTQQAAAPAMRTLASVFDKRTLASMPITLNHNGPPR